MTLKSSENGQSFPTLGNHSHHRHCSGHRLSGLHPATGLGRDGHPAQDTPTDCRGLGMHASLTPVDVCLPCLPRRRFCQVTNVSFCVSALLRGNLVSPLGTAPIRPTGPFSAPPHTTNHTLQAASVWRGPLSLPFPPHSCGDGGRGF